MILIKENLTLVVNFFLIVDFEYDVKDLLYFRIDRKKKIYVSTLLLALGYTKLDVADEYYVKETYTFDTKINKWKTKFNPENYKSKNFSEEIIDAKNGKVVVKLGEKVNFLNAKKLFDDGLKEIFVSNESLYSKYLHKDIAVGTETLKNLLS